MGVERVVLVAGPAGELGGVVGMELSLVAAVLVDAGLGEIPSLCFWGSDNLVLVGLPVKCVAICYGAFMGCGALIGIDLEKVEVLEGYAFQDCYSLSHVGTHFRVRSIGGGAFQAVAVTEFRFESLLRVDNEAFLSSALKGFTGRVDSWGDEPFLNSRDLRRLEMWPG
jgi:hypothetical protein